MLECWISLMIWLDQDVERHLNVNTAEGIKAFLVLRVSHECCLSGSMERGREDSFTIESSILSFPI